MRNLKYLILTSCIAFGSCNLSDDVVQLSGNYSFYHESMDDNTIYNEGGDEAIPCNVVAYDYNNDYIVAKQIRTRQCDLEKRTEYPNSDSIFYWIVAHKGKKFLGPLTLIDYQQKRISLNIPSDLQPQETGYIKLSSADSR